MVDSLKEIPNHLPDLGALGLPRCVLCVAEDLLIAGAHMPNADWARLVEKIEALH